MAQDSRQQHQDYVTLVYILLLSISVIILLVGAQFQGDARSLLFGFGTEILGAVIIFLLVEKVLLRRNLNLHVRLEHIAERLDRKTHFLRRVKDNLPFDELIADATDISVASNSMGRLLRTYEGPLRMRLENGAHLKLLFLAPSGSSCQLLSEQSGKNFKSAIENSLEGAHLLEDYCKKINKGRVEIKTIDWPTSCSIHLIDPEKDSGYIRVTIHTLHPSLPITHRPHFLLSKTGEQFWYESYQEQFNTLWEKAI